MMNNNEEKKNYSVELNPLYVPNLLMFLNVCNIRFDISECYNLTHIEILNATQKQADDLNYFISNLDRLEQKTREIAYNEYKNNHNIA